MFTVSASSTSPAVPSLQSFVPSVCSISWSAMVNVKLPKRPRAVVLELRGVLADKSFDMYSNEKMKFYNEKIRTFVSQDLFWEKNHKGIHLKNIYKMARVEQSARKSKKSQFPGEPNLPHARDESDMQDSLREYMLFMLKHHPNDRTTSTFFEWMQVWGYDENLLTTPLYSDVLPFLKYLKSLSIPILLTGASEKAFNRLLKRTTAGDIRSYFYTDQNHDTGHTNIDFKKRDHPFKFDLLASKDAVLITHSHVLANNAHGIGITVVMVVRRDWNPTWHPHANLETDSGPIDLPGDKSDPANEVPSLEGQEESLTRYKSGELGTGQHGNASRITEDDERRFPVITKLSELKFP